jgi:hypothetical protein
MNEDSLIRKKTISDYNSVYNLWLRTSGMGMNNIDDSEKRYRAKTCRQRYYRFENEGIAKVALVVFKKNDRLSS